MRLGLLVPTLAACATIPAPSDDFPSRREVEELLFVSDNLCSSISVASQIDCVAVPRRRLHMLRCRSDPPEDQPARLLCHFAGRQTLPGGRRVAFGPDCARLSRVLGAWRIDSYPDADVCDS